MATTPRLFGPGPSLFGNTRLFDRKGEASERERLFGTQSLFGHDGRNHNVYWLTTNKAREEYLLSVPKWATEARETHAPREIVKKKRSRNYRDYKEENAAWEKHLRVFDKYSREHSLPEMQRQDKMAFERNQIAKHRKAMDTIWERLSEQERREVIPEIEMDSDARVVESVGKQKRDKCHVDGFEEDFRSLCNKLLEMFFENRRAFEETTEQLRHADDVGWKHIWDTVVKQIPTYWGDRARAEAKEEREKERRMFEKRLRRRHSILDEDWYGRGHRFHTYNDS